MRHFLLVFILLISKSSYCQNLFDAKKTQAVIVGVLNWEDSSMLHSFKKENRKDKELDEQLKTIGLEENQISLLLDKEATAVNMLLETEKRLKNADEESCFLFYYAGHGAMIKSKTYFCNYDFNYNNPKQNFNPFSLVKLINKSKAKRIILMADCCYSGVLMNVALKIKSNKEVIVLTSSTASNLSTANWTFTQTFLDNLNGLAVGDINQDKKISIGEMKSELEKAMKYKESQKAGFYIHNINEESTVSIVQKDKTEIKNSGKDYLPGEFVYALSRGNWKAGRVLSNNLGEITVEFYDYSKKRTEIIDRKNVRKIGNPDYSSFTNVEVEWNGKYYPAKIIKSENDFYYIKYDNYDNVWNEWVMYDRIKTGVEKKTTIQWNLGWYEGEILQEKDGKYFVTYTGYNHTWDEWVDESRVKK